VKLENEQPEFDVFDYVLSIPHPKGSSELTLKRSSLVVSKTEEKKGMSTARYITY